MTPPPWPARRVDARILWTAGALALAACATPVPLPNAAQQSATSTSQSAARALARGDLAQAQQLYERALASAASVEDFAAAGATLLNLALVQARRGELAAAHERVDRVLAAPQRYGAALHAGAATRKALLYLDTPDLDAALRWAETAEAVCPSPCTQSAALSVLRAHVAMQRNDPAAAIGWSERGLAAATQAGQANEQANALRLLGRARSQSGLTAQAANDLAQALAIDQRLGLPERVALDLVYAGENEQRRERAAAAREFYERALIVYQAAGLSQGADSVRARLVALR